jgi:flagellar biosynthesis protein FliR
MAPIIFSPSEVLRFAIVLLRISGIVIFAPFFSSQSIPYQIRIAFSLMAAIVVMPSLPMQALPVEFGLGSIVAVFLSEVMFGLILGFAANLIFAGMQFAGQIVSFQLGFSLINLIDPQTNVESPAFSFFHNYIGLMFFLLINGHHWFLLAVNESFQVMPVGGMHLQAPLVDHLIRMSSQILVIGLRIAGPVLAVSIITDVVMGVIGRAAPHVNILIVGMPLKILVGFGSLGLCFYFLPRFLETAYSSLFRSLFALVHAMV